jgi:hypothetical protein
MDHHAVQRALVLMLYDEQFESLVRRASPDLFNLPLEALQALRAIDPRAIRADRLRRRRTLAALVEEFRTATTIAAEEVRSRRFLEEEFFASRHFHRAVEQERPIALAFGAYLGGAWAAGRLRTPQLPDVIALELAQALCRRAARPVENRPDAPSVRLAPGVVFRRLAADVMETVKRVEEFLFELSLVPQLAQCEDGPRLALPATPSQERAPYLVVPTASGVSVVTLDEELAAVIKAIGDGALQRSELLQRSTQAGMARERVEQLVAELLDDEVLEGTA